MGGTFKNIGDFMAGPKSALDPLHLVFNKGQPVTWRSLGQSAHAAADPLMGNLGPMISAHNNTQDNWRGFFDPGQMLLGPNSTSAPPPQMPANFLQYTGPGSTRPGPGYTNGAAGAATNGLSGPSTATNGLATLPSTQVSAPSSQAPALSQQPNWAAIIGRALTK